MESYFGICIQKPTPETPGRLRLLARLKRSQGENYWSLDPRFDPNQLGDAPEVIWPFDRSGQDKNPAAALGMLYRFRAIPDIKRRLLLIENRPHNKGQAIETFGYHLLDEKHVEWKSGSRLLPPWVPAGGTLYILARDHRHLIGPWATLACQGEHAGRTQLGLFQDTNFRPRLYPLSSVPEQGGIVLSKPISFRGYLVRMPDPKQAQSLTDYVAREQQESRLTRPTKPEGGSIVQSPPQRQSASSEKPRPAAPSGERARPTAPSGERARPTAPSGERARPAAPSGERARPTAAKAPSSERPKPPAAAVPPTSGEGENMGELERSLRDLLHQMTNRFEQANQQEQRLLNKIGELESAIARLKQQEADEAAASAVRSITDTVDDSGSLSAEDEVPTASATFEPDPSAEAPVPTAAASEETALPPASGEWALPSNSGESPVPAPPKPRRKESGSVEIPNFDPSASISMVTGFGSGGKPVPADPKVYYDELMEEKRFNEAVRVAQSQLEWTEKNVGEESMEAADWLHRLGTACQKMNRPDEAEQYFKRAIKIRIKPLASSILMRKDPQSSFGE